MAVPSYLRDFITDYKEYSDKVTANIVDTRGGKLFEIWYYGEYLKIPGLKYPIVVNTEFSIPKFVAKSVKTGEEILLFDRAFHGYNAMFCNRFPQEEIENRPLKKLDIPPSEIKIEFYYNIDFDAEKDDYDFNKNGDCILLDGTAMPWEEVKVNGMDCIGLYYKSEKGRWIKLI